MSNKTSQIAATLRTEKGSGAARRARAKGLVPAVIYSNGKSGETLYVNASEWAALSRQGVGLVELKGDGIDKLAFVKEVQINHMKNQYIHIDFNEVIRGQKAHGTVVVHAKPGSVPAGVAHGGVLQQLLHEIHIVCLPKNMPTSIEVAVEALEVGGSLLVKDLILPEGVEADGHLDAVVFHVVHQKLEAEAAAPEAAPEPAVVAKKKKEEEK